MEKVGLGLWVFDDRANRTTSAGEFGVEFDIGLLVIDPTVLSLPRLPTTATDTGASHIRWTTFALITYMLKGNVCAVCRL